MSTSQHSESVDTSANAQAHTTSQTTQENQADHTIEIAKNSQNFEEQSVSEIIETVVPQNFNDFIERYPMECPLPQGSQHDIDILFDHVLRVSLQMTPQNLENQDRFLEAQEYALQKCQLDCKRDGRMQPDPNADVNAEVDQRAHIVAKIEKQIEKGLMSKRQIAQFRRQQEFHRELDAIDFTDPPQSDVLVEPDIENSQKERTECTSKSIIAPITEDSVALDVEKKFFEEQQQQQQQQQEEEESQTQTSQVDGLETPLATVDEGNAETNVPNVATTSSDKNQADMDFISKKLAKRKAAVASSQSSQSNTDNPNKTLTAERINASRAALSNNNQKDTSEGSAASVAEEDEEKPAFINYNNLRWEDLTEEDKQNVLNFVPLDKLKPCVPPNAVAPSMPEDAVIDHLNPEQVFQPIKERWTKFEYAREFEDLEDKGDDYIRQVLAQRKKELSPAFEDANIGAQVSDGSFVPLENKGKYARNDIPELTLFSNSEPGYRNKFMTLEYDPKKDKPFLYDKKVQFFLVSTMGPKCKHKAPRYLARIWGAVESKAKGKKLMKKVMRDNYYGHIWEFFLYPVQSWWEIVPQQKELNGKPNTVLEANQDYQDYVQSSFDHKKQVALELETRGLDAKATEKASRGEMLIRQLGQTTHVK